MAEELETRFNQIKRIVNHAYRTVPLYRRKYDRVGIHPTDIRCLDDFRKLPILTKTELQEGFPDDIISDRIRAEHCYVISTSGHSGSPVKLYRRKNELSILPWLYLTAYPFIPTLVKRFTGIKAGRKTTLIFPRDESYDLYRAVESLSAIPAILTQSYQYLATEDGAEAHLLALQAHRPDVIASDLSALKNIITYARSHQLEIPQVKVMFVGSELIDGHSRSLLTRAFGGKIVEHYGSEEAGTIAFECPNGDGLHLLRRTNYLEIIKDGHPAPAGTAGEVVITNLLNRATPIIRYNGMGDVATINPLLCRCNNPQVTLKMVDGRVVDSFILPDGRLIHPFKLTIPLEHIAGVGSYQIRQERPDLVRVLLVTDSGPASILNSDMVSVMTTSIETGLQNILGSDVQIEVNTVDDIPHPPGPRHKARPVISLVNRNDSPPP